MCQRKLLERLGIAEELRAQGIEYTPFVWSTFGKSHDMAASVLWQLARDCPGGGEEQSLLPCYDACRRTSEYVWHDGLPE
jgi:hypothetical protein